MYFCLIGTKFMRTLKEGTFCLGWKSSASSLRQCGMHTQGGGWRCSYKHHHTYAVFTQQCHSCSNVPHNVKTSELISMQLTSTTDSGTDSQLSLLSMVECSQVESPLVLALGPAVNTSGEGWPGQGMRVINRSPSAQQDSHTKCHKLQKVLQAQAI